MAFLTKNESVIVS